MRAMGYAYSDTVQSSIRKAGSPITFGIEIEAVLAFHKSKLQAVLRKYYGSIPSIVQDIPYDANFTFVDASSRSHNCRELYPSWLLKVPNDRELDRTLGLMLESSHTILGQDAKYRKYLAEPLIIAKEILQNHGLSAEVRAEVRSTSHPIVLGEEEPANTIVLRAVAADTTKWTLTTDHSLIGLLESQLQAALPDDFMENSCNTSVSSPMNTGRRVWDSAGFELISPVLEFAKKDAAYATISDYLLALRSGTKWRSLQSPWAALHVHIGLDFVKPEDAPLLLLQHLAYILICHEDLISKLHPRSRCGIPCKPNTQVDDVDIEHGLDEDFDPDAPAPPFPTQAEIQADNENAVLRTERTHTGSVETGSNRRYFLHNLQGNSRSLPRLSAIRAKIFNPELSVPELIALLQKGSPNSNGNPLNRHRGYMYNFNNITAMFIGSTWKTPKPTIEFRQHACSTDPIEVQRWVDFCFALVSFAERMANKTTQWRSDAHLSSQQESLSSGRGVSEGKQNSLNRGSGIQTACGNKFAEVEGSKYPPSSEGSWPCVSISKFLGPEFLNLDAEAIHYWQNRYEKYKDDRPGPDEIDESEESHRHEFGS